MTENKNNRSVDADLLTRVGIALTMRLSHTLHAIHIQVDNGVVILRGLVPSFYDRQLAIEVTRRVAGVLKVRDELSVATPSGGFDKAWTPQSSNVRQPRSSQATNASPGAGTDSGKRSLASAVEGPRNELKGLPLERGWRGLFSNAATVLRGLFLALAVLAVGCGQGTEAPPIAVHPAQGKITFKGQPTHGAMVTLHPKTAAADVPNPRATVDKTGAFKLSTFAAGDGAPEGDYVLTVFWYKPIQNGPDVSPGPNVIPVKYTKPETTNIEIKIAAGQNDLSTIQL
jgi:hypothetical protein